MRRIGSWATVLVLAAFALAGCQASSGGTGTDAKVKTDVAANIGDYQVQKVAILGFVNLTGEKEAEQLVGYVTRALHDTGKYQFFGADDLVRESTRLGIEGDYNRCFDTWKKVRALDGDKLTRFLEAVGYDAVVGIEINKWSENKLDPSQEGTSDTTVGLKVEMFAPDGTVLWSASLQKIEKSAPYYPSFNTRATTSGEARTTSTSAVPEPPAIEKVAMDAANELAATLPDIKGGAS